MSEMITARKENATYIVHERQTVDTRDHEDHTFNGVMFNICCKELLPIESISIDSLSVRGALGPMSVWCSKEGAYEDKREDQTQWYKLYEGNHEPNFESLVELKFTCPMFLEPGEVRGFYVHSALPGDEGLVYDNSKSDVTHSDNFICVTSGLAHISNTPFSPIGMWGWGGSWRGNREFVGRLSYGAQYKLWNPRAQTHLKFPDHFKTMVWTFLMAANRLESPLSYLPGDVLLYILNMLRWDWALPDGASRKITDKEPTRVQRAMSSGRERVGDARSRMRMFHAQLRALGLRIVQTGDDDSDDDDDGYGYTVEYDDMGEDGEDGEDSEDEEYYYTGSRGVDVDVDDSSDEDTEYVTRSATTVAEALAESAARREEEEMERESTMGRVFSNIRNTGSNIVSSIRRRASSADTTEVAVTCTAADLDSSDSDAGDSDK